MIYKKGDQLIITKTYVSDDYLSPGDVVEFVKENVIVYIVMKDNIHLVCGKANCELLEDHRNRIINSIINEK